MYLTIIDHTHNDVAPCDPLEPGRLHIQITSGVAILLQNSRRTVRLDQIGSKMNGVSIILKNQYSV